MAETPAWPKPARGNYGARLTPRESRIAPSRARSQPGPPTPQTALTDGSWASFFRQTVLKAGSGRFVFFLDGGFALTRLTGPFLGGGGLAFAVGLGFHLALPRGLGGITASVAVQSAPLVASSIFEGQGLQLAAMDFAFPARP